MLCGFNPDHYNGHSVRIGAAKTAGKAHIEDHLDAGPLVITVGI